MTTTPPEAPTGSAGGPDPESGHDQGPRVTRDEVRDLTRLRRHGYDRKVAGVAGGLARHFDIDPIIVRVAFVVLIFFGGAGLLVYGACWLLVPEDGAESAPIRLDDRSRSVALLVVGVIAALALLGDSLGGWGFPWPLAIIAVIVLLFMNRRGSPPPAPLMDPQTGQPYPSAPYPTATYPTTQYPTAQYPTAGYQPPSMPRQPHPRGPILFWFTLALIALGIGVLGIVDLAGASVADAAYPALALVTTGAMLTLSAFYGRGGGLILVGLVAAVATAGATAAGEFEATDVTRTPLTASAVEDSYDVGAGALELDLTEVSDLEALDGRTISLNADLGEILVIVPDDLRVEAEARIEAGGEIRLFGTEQGGFGLSESATQEAGGDAPSITLDADLTFGGIEIRTEGDNR